MSFNITVNSSCPNPSKINIMSSHTGGIFIDGDEIDKKSFCTIIRYFLTNVDLEDNDIKLSLLEDISEMTIVRGFNIGKERLEFKQKWNMI